MAYLRKEKLLIEADVHTPLAPGAEPPKVPIHKRSISKPTFGGSISTWDCFAKSSCESIASCRFAQVRLVCFFLRRASIGDGFLTLDEP